MKLFFQIHQKGCIPNYCDCFSAAACNSGYKSKLNRFNYNRICFTLLFVASVCLFSSCLVSKPGNYFKNITRDTTISNTSNLPAELLIKPKDALAITISSINKMEDQVYNAVATEKSGVPGLKVSSEGYIHLHKLGKVKAAGLTRKQLKAYLEKELASYLKDPIVEISFTNHFVTILGEIGKQQLLPITDESISIVDVLAQSGSISPVTKLTEVLIIREKAQTKEFRHVNLEDHSIFTSAYYYIQPNDVVVLNADEKIVKQQLRREKYLQTSSIILQLLSVTTIVYQIFFR